MAYVRTLNDIITNITTLEGYLTQGTAEESAFAKELILTSTSMVVYKVEGVNHFAPNLFVGYAGNTMKNHKSSGENDHSEADKKVAKIVGKDAFLNNIMETNFNKYCVQLGVKPAKNERSYLRLYEGGGYLEL